MNILFVSIQNKIIEKIFFQLKDCGIKNGDILKIYSNTECKHCNLANVGVTFIENMNVKEFIKEKQINMVIANQIHNYMLDDNSFFIVSLRKSSDTKKPIYFYKDIPLLINQFKMSNLQNENKEDIIDNKTHTIKNNINVDLDDTDISNTNTNTDIVAKVSISKNKNINSSINIFIIKLSNHAMNKIIDILNSAIIENNISSDKLNIFSNIKINNYLKIIYVEKIKTIDEICNFVKDKNVNIFITNYVNNAITNNLKNSYIVSLIPSNRSDVHFYKELPSILCECMSQVKYIKNNNKLIVHENKIDNPKELYRSICLRYLDDFKKLEIPKLHLQLNKEAVLIEYRILPHMEVLLRNMIYNLGDSWSYSIVCGNNNFSYVKQMCDTMSNNIKIIQTNFDNLTQNEYNNMLLTTDFWDLFYGEKILIYQEDTCIFRKDIDSYLEFDYVGGAFALDCVIPINVGNGGFSLRTKSIMKKIIDNMPPKNFFSNCNFSKHFKNVAKLDLFPEDNYFPQVMQNLNIGKIAPYEVCKRFSSEQIFTENSLGMHCLWFSNKNWEQHITNYFNNLFKNYNKVMLKLNNTNKNNKKKINIYFIHCNDFQDRNTKIEKVQQQLSMEYGNNYKINIFKGVNTSNHPLDFENQIKTLKEHDINLNFDDPKKFIFYKGGQIGCYLGHHLIVKNIAENIQDDADYSIIFEDDIYIKNNFTSSLLEIIEYFETKNETFDVIYLGHLNDNKGTQKHNNIYNLNKSYWNFGAHGLLINNKSAPKLYKFNCNILHEADNQYKLLYNKDFINAYYIKEPLVFQDRKSFSYINLKNNNLGK